MGFTFSFPVHQSSLNEGTLMKWTKGFTCTGIFSSLKPIGVEGKDVVALLNSAFSRAGLNISIKAIVNDTVLELSGLLIIGTFQNNEKVGTLIAHSYKDPQTFISGIHDLTTSVILGTGTNAAYVEKVSNVKKWKSELEGSEMVINTEWGGYRYFLPTDQKRAIDPSNYHLGHEAGQKKPKSEETNI